MITNLNKSSLFDEERIFKFDIEYVLDKDRYNDHVEIVLKSYSDLIQTRAATTGKELKIISYALQDLLEKNL